jgi:hypothetical protein
MPTFLDTNWVHSGVSASDVAGARRVDLGRQVECGVNLGRCSVDEPARKILCLVYRPDAEMARRVRREAHGPLAGETHDVPEGS